MTLNAPLEPYVGASVHYHSYGTPGGEYLPEARAAIITGVHRSTTPNDEDWLGRRQLADEHWSDYDGGYVRDEEVPEYIVNVDLFVMNPTGVFLNQHLEFSPTPKPGHWSWPPARG